MWLAWSVLAVAPTIATSRSGNEEIPAESAEEEEDEEEESDDGVYNEDNHIIACQTHWLCYNNDLAP